MMRKVLAWPLLGYLLTGAPLLLLGLVFSVPAPGERLRAAWATLLLSGAGLSSGYLILRLGPRRSIRLLGLAVVPLATFLYLILDSEGATAELSQAMAPGGTTLSGISYPDNPMRTAISWFFLYVPFARSLVFLIIPGFVAVVVAGLAAFARGRLSGRGPG